MLLPNFEECSEGDAGLPITPLINIHSEYEQKTLQDDSGDCYVFQSPPGIHRQSWLLQGATRSLSTFDSISQTIVSGNLWSITDIVYNTVGATGWNSWYRGEEVDRLLGVWIYVMEHLQNLDDVPADVWRAAATTSWENSDWCCNRVKVVKLVWWGRKVAATIKGWQDVE
jgi:hypothetical protein